MYNRVKIFLAIELAIVALYGCGARCDSEFESARIEKIEAVTISYNAYDDIDLIPFADSVTFDKHAIWMTVEPEFISLHATSMNAAYACSPDIPLLEERIEEIRIYTLIEYNNIILEGEDVSEHFVVLTDKHELDLNDDLIDHYFRTDYYLFFKSKLPIINNQFLQFEVELTLTNGATYVVTSDRVFTLVAN